MATQKKGSKPNDQAEKAAWDLVTNWFGKRLLVSILTVTVLIGWALEIRGHTLTIWHYVQTLFSERISVLTGAELEVANEWVVYVDRSAEFLQVEAYRSNLANSESANSQEAWRHFVRNLRIVRDPNYSENWLLVADITPGESTEQTVRATIECAKRKVGNWAELDTFGSSLENSYAFQYKIAEFAETYGRPRNFEISNTPDSHAGLSELESEPECPYPYNDAEQDHARDAFSATPSDPLQMRP